MTALGPFVVTPDEVAALWDGRPLSGRYVCEIQGRRIGDLEPGSDAAFGYADPISDAAKTREQLETGAAQTEYLRFGDRLRLATFVRQGQSIFGAIDQSLQRWPGQPR